MRVLWFKAKAPVLQGTLLRKHVRQLDVDAMNIESIEGAVGVSVRKGDKSWFVPINNIEELECEPVPKRPRGRPPKEKAIEV